MKKNAATVAAVAMAIASAVGSDGGAPVPAANQGTSTGWRSPRSWLGGGHSSRGYQGVNQRQRRKRAAQVRG